MRKLFYAMCPAALALAALAAVACSDDGNPLVAGSTPASTASPAAAATPSGGPFVVWIADSGSALGAQTVSVYDLATRGQVSSFDVPGLFDPSHVVVAGERIIANHGYEVVAYGLDGSHDVDHPFRTVAYRLGGMAASPDGETLALTYANDEVDACDAGGCIPAAETGFVAFVDAATGDDVATVFRHDTPGFAGFSGDLSNPAWRDDATGVVVFGNTASGRPGSVATVFLDGRVRRHDPLFYGFRPLAPNGRYFAEGTLEFFCVDAVRRDVQIRDLDSDRVIASVADSGPWYSWQAWSPASDSLLYSTFEIMPDPIRPDCPRLLIDEPTRRWYLLPADGTPPQPIADSLAANRAWHGDRAIEYECRGERLIDAYCQGPQTQPEEMRVYVGGQLIGSGKNARVVGFVEP